MIIKINKAIFKEQSKMRGEKFAEWGFFKRLVWVVALLLPLWVVVFWGS
jgi:hypothetical protein